MANRKQSGARRLGRHLDAAVEEHLRSHTESDLETHATEVGATELPWIEPAATQADEKGTESGSDDDLWEVDFSDHSMAAFKKNATGDIVYAQLATLEELEGIDETAEYLAHFPDGQVCPVAGLMNSTVQMMLKKTADDKRQGPLWSKEHNTTHTKCRISQRADKKLLISFYVSKKQKCQVRVDLFGEVPDGPIKVLDNQHTAVQTAANFMIPFAEKFITGEYDAEEMKKGEICDGRNLRQAEQAGQAEQDRQGEQEIAKGSEECQLAIWAEGTIGNESKSAKQSKRGQKSKTAKRSGVDLNSPVIVLDDAPESVPTPKRRCSRKTTSSTTSASAESIGCFTKLTTHGPPPCSASQWSAFWAPML